MSGVLLIVLGLAAGIADECPASLVLQIEGLSVRSTQAAQGYADCVSQPWLPASDARPQKIAQCAARRPRAADEKIAKAATWVEGMAANFPGCETRLEIKKR